jgi:hypothetical protein
MIEYPKPMACSHDHLSGRKPMEKAVACKINKLEVTSDTLTGRGGLAFLVKYIQAIGIVSLLLRQFAGI